MDESAQDQKSTLETIEVPRKKTLWRHYGHVVPYGLRTIQFLVGVLGAVYLGFAIIAVAVVLVRGDSEVATRVAVAGILGPLLILVAVLIGKSPFLGTLAAAVLQTLGLLATGSPFAEAILFTSILWVATWVAWRFERRQAGLLERSQRKRQKP